MNHLCLRCKNEEFRINQDAVIEQDYKGMILHVQIPAIVCTECGWTTLSNDQIDELLKRTELEYEKRLKSADLQP